MYKLIIVFFILVVFLLLRKSYEGFNILDYQFGEKNKPLYVEKDKSLIPIFGQENDPWVVKNINLVDVTSRLRSEFLPAPTVNLIQVPTEAPKPKLIDYQFSEFNFPSNPIDKMKVNSYAPWSSVKQIDRYIIPQSVTPYAINLYSDYISK